MLKRTWPIVLFALLLAGTIVPGAWTQEAEQTSGAEQSAEGEQPAAEAADETPEAEGKKAFWTTVKEEILGTGPEQRRSWVHRVKSAVIILFLAWLTYRLAMIALRRAEKRLTQTTAGTTRGQARQKQQVATLVGLLRSIVWYIIAITAGVLLLDNVAGVNVVPLLTGAGIAGVAIAFGCQALVRDVVSGLFQLLEGQYAVGDYVQIGAAFGKVEHVGLRVTRLRDLQDKLYFIPNGTITMVTTYDDATQEYILQAPFADEAQSEAALVAAGQLATALREEFPELVKAIGEPKVVTTDSGLYSVKMRLSIVPTQEWVVNEEVPARIKQLFAAAEVTVPEGRAPRCYLDISPLAKMPKTSEKTE
jgi:small-conductance mechanosensitive channel